MRSGELNLLLVFNTIMLESSITKAAERLHMSQSAVSNAVARMRHLWEDELFVKDGRGILPTAHAQQLWEQVKRPLADIANALHPEFFNPAESNRTFRVAAVDAVAGLVWPQLAALVVDVAPNIRIRTFPYTLVDGKKILDNAEVDLLLAANNLMPPSATSHYLIKTNYICAMRPDHPLASSNLTLKRYARARHLLVAPSGDDFGYADQVLGEHNFKRSIAMTVNSFAFVPQILAQSDLICTVPSCYVEDALISKTIVPRALPMKMESTKIFMYWHARAEQDQGLIWFRKMLQALYKRRLAAHRELVVDLLSN